MPPIWLKTAGRGVRGRCGPPGRIASTGRGSVGTSVRGTTKRCTQEQRRKHRGLSGGAAHAHEKLWRKDGASHKRALNARGGVCARKNQQATAGRGCVLCERGSSNLGPDEAGAVGALGHAFVCGVLDEVWAEAAKLATGDLGLQIIGGGLVGGVKQSIERVVPGRGGSVRGGASGKGETGAVRPRQWRATTSGRARAPAARLR